ncbi:hypothetical protein [Pseudofrankia sp. DC12]|uniref:hypothetical protein n=1 Tax=Pseudofrankia sp. DC12 TaxID=683315 RepID=UPI000AE35511|nr:hypothetical protein [Pseudofrankia sp. DC12]
MAIELGFVSTLTQAAARLLGLSKGARQRRDVMQYTKLYATLKKEDGLEIAAQNIAALLGLTTRQLLNRETIAAKRTYQWGSLVAAIFLDLIIASPIMWLFPPNKWWKLLIIAVIVGIAILILGAGISTVRKQPTLDEIAQVSPAQNGATAG